MYGEQRCSEIISLPHCERKSEPMEWLPCSSDSVLPISLEEGTVQSHSTEWPTKALRGEVICSRSHRQQDKQTTATYHTHWRAPGRSQRATVGGKAGQWGPCWGGHRA